MCFTAIYHYSEFIGGARRAPQGTSLQGNIFAILPTFGRETQEKVWQFKSFNIPKRLGNKISTDVRSVLHSFFKSTFYSHPLGKAAGQRVAIEFQKKMRGPEN